MEICTLTPLANEATVDLLSSLIDKSPVSRVGRNVQARFRLHANLLNKLGMHSRTKIAVWFSEQRPAYLHCAKRIDPVDISENCGGQVEASNRRGFPPGTTHALTRIADLVDAAQFLAIALDSAWQPWQSRGGSAR